MLFLATKKMWQLVLVFYDIEVCVF